MMFFIRRELRRLTKQLDEIIINDTNARLTTAASDKDVAALVISINNMLEQNRMEIFEKNRAEDALRRAVTNISHDLRTPLTSALGYLQMYESGALDSDLDDETKKRYMGVVKGRLEALTVLMNALFEYTRIIEGSEKLSLQKVNVCNVLRDTLSGCYAELEAEGFTVEAEIPDKPVIWVCDVNALQRIFQNLIKNVYVHGKEYLLVRVSDSTVEMANKADGLEDTDAERIFERFYTSDASRTRKNTGLGLAIARELTQRMGGRLSAAVNGNMLTIMLMLPKAQE